MLCVWHVYDMCMLCVLCVDDMVLLYARDVYAVFIMCVACVLYV